MPAAINGTPDATTGYLVSDLISLALRQIGIGAMGTGPSAVDVADGVMHLNLLLAQWQRRGWLVPNLTDVFCASTGASIYFVGPGGDIDVPVRPARIMGAFARLASIGGSATGGDFSAANFSADFLAPNDGLSSASPIDYSLTEIPSYQDYAAIGLKGLKTWPSAYFYNPAFPLGEFRPWPIPAAGVWQLHLLIAQPLPSRLGTDSPLNLPPEYWDALVWTLAVRLAPSYGQEASPTAVANARAALTTIRTANLRVPTLGTPAALSSARNPFYWPGLEAQKL